MELGISRYVKVTIGIALSALLLVAMLRYVYCLQPRQRLGKNATSRPTSSTEGSVPYIPTPVGWERMPIQKDQLGIVAEFSSLPIPTSTHGVGFVIEVDSDGYITDKPPLGQFLSGSGLYSSLTSTQTWSAINSHLILGTAFPTRVNYTVIDTSGSTYSDYSFSLTAYQPNAPGLSDVPFSPADIQLLQAMTQTFAAQWR